MRAQRIKTGFGAHARVLAVAATLAVYGCSGNSTGDAGAKQQVEVGMTQSQVLSIMGQPQRRENHGGTEFLIYPADDANKTALINFFPIAIVDGRVTGIGRHVYDHFVRSKAQFDLNPQREPSDPRR
jgi:hypothetical protein